MPWASTSAVPFLSLGESSKTGESNGKEQGNDMETLGLGSGVGVWGAGCGFRALEAFGPVGLQV